MDGVNIKGAVGCEKEQVATPTNHKAVNYISSICYNVCIPPFVSLVPKLSFQTSSNTFLPWWLGLLISYMGLIMSRRLLWRSFSNRRFNVTSRWNNVSILSGVQGFGNHKLGTTSKLYNHFGINITNKIALNRSTNRPEARLTWIEQLSN